MIWSSEVNAQRNYEGNLYDYIISLVPANDLTLKQLGYFFFQNVNLFSKFNYYKYDTLSMKMVQYNE